MAASLTPRSSAEGYGVRIARARAVLYPMAALSVAAALVHLWMAPKHFQEWWGYGTFFLATAAAQALYGVALVRRPGQRLLLAGMAGNLAVVALYALTRTAGVPFFGPHAWHPENVGGLDLAVAGAEVAIVFATLPLLEGRLRATAANGLVLLAAAGALSAGAWGFFANLDARGVPAGIGEPVHVSGGILRVERVMPEQMADMQAGKFGQSGMSMSATGMDMAAEGQRRFTVELTLAAKDRVVSYAAEDFRITGEGLKEAEPIRHQLEGGTLPAGSAVSATMVFQAPEDAEDLALSFDGGRPVDLGLGPVAGGASNGAAGAEANGSHGH